MVVPQVFLELADPFFLLLSLELLVLALGFVGLVQRLQEDQVPLLVVLLLRR